FEQAGVVAVLGEIAAVADSPGRVVAVVNDERLRAYEGKHVADVEGEDRPHLGERSARARSEALDPSIPLRYAGTVDDRRPEESRRRPRPPVGVDAFDRRLLGPEWHAGRIVVCASQPREAVDEDQGVDLVRVRRG